MTRRILSLLLALCLVVGLLPMIALAEEAPALTSSLVITTGTHEAKIQWNPKLSEGMAPAYAKTTAEGSLVKEGTENDYNLKVEWPVGGKPTLTMNGATLNNDTHHYSDSDPAVEHTIAISGTADFVILLKGTNTINGNHAQARTDAANHRAANGIVAKNTGDLYIRSIDREVDTLLIDNYGGNGIYKYYTQLFIESANIYIKLRTASTNGQNGIILNYSSASYADNTNLTVRDSYLTVFGTGRYFGNTMINLEKPSNGAANTGDILFQNSKIVLDRNNGTSANSTGSEIIKYSSASTCVIDNCDFQAYGNHRTVRYAPEFKNCIDVQHREGWGTWSAYTFTPQQSISSNTNNSALKATHTCVAGEPVLEKAGDCAESADTVTYCTVFFCGKELSREETALEPSKAHNPGAKTLLKQTKATLAVKNGAAYTAGTYQWQYTCSVCAATWEETEEFNPGVLFYRTYSTDYHSTDDKTVPYYQYGSSWNANYYSPNYTIQPGTTLYFLTQDNKNTNIPTNSYMIPTTDATVIANGTWNIKIEYPVGGTPVMTLQGATIINGAGIWWGYGIHRNTAPLKIIVKGNNRIEQTRYTNGGVLNFSTKADVTITGDGTLNLVSNGNGAAIRSYGGNIIFDHANINLKNYSTSSAHHGVQTETGSITIDGGNFNMFGNRNNASEVYSAIRSAGDITIKGGANVTITQAVGSNDYGLLHATGNVTISESYVKLASVYRGHAIRYGGTLTMDYVNGFTAKSIQTLTTLTIEKDEETGAETNRFYTYPDLTSATVSTTVDGVISYKSRYFMEITPNKALESFTGTAVTVKDDLDVSFKMSAEAVADDCKVKFTVNGEEIEKNLSEVSVTEGADCVITLPGLSAKQMRDKITVTVYDGEGNTLTETKSDSVVDYALRLLRDDKYAEDNAVNNAMKTFVADMLVYGAMAQIQFGQPGEALVTDVLNANEWKYATATTPEATKTPATTSNAGYVGTSFELKSNIGMAVALYAETLPGVTYAKVTFTDYKGNPKEFTVATKDATSNSKYTVFVFNELAAANGRQDITWTFYNAEDEVQLTVTDSLANYVGRMRDTYPYVDELLKYCDSAKAYFSLANA